MPLSLLAIVSALLYLVAAGIQLMHVLQRRRGLGLGVILSGSVALLCHAAVAWQSVVDTSSVHLGFYKIAALIFFIINLACIVFLLKRPLQNLLLALLPLSAAAVLVSAFAPETGRASGPLQGGLLLHVSASLLAYALLTLAALQAALLAVQDRQLKHHHPTGIVRLLPPLQLMESMLFELLWAGVVVLGAAIVSGFLFVENIFAQHLVHKTILTIIAWVIYGVLLWGHHQLGWRSQTAVRLTLVAFVLLVLAFFGSKLVLELVLQRP
ncbi:cytochrome C assembly family protein [Haliea atlantica]